MCCNVCMYFAICILYTYTFVLMMCAWCWLKASHPRRSLVLVALLCLVNALTTLSGAKAVAAELDGLFRMGRLWGLGFKVNEVGVTLDSWILWQAESDADDPKILLALQAKDTFHFDVPTKVKKVDRRQCGTPFRRRTRSNTSHVLKGKGRSMDLIGRSRLFRPFRLFRLFTSLVTSPMSSWMLAFCRKSLRDVSRCSTLTWIAEKKIIDFQHWEPIQGIITPAVLESWCCGQARSWQSKPWPCVTSFYVFSLPCFCWNI